MRLELRLPYDWEHVLAFLDTHAIPGVDLVADGRYLHTFAVDGDPARSGVVSVARVKPTSLAVTLPGPLAGERAGIVPRIRALFDLDTQPDTIAAQLARDATIAPSLAARPGLRVAGAFDGFELAVRTILGQQVSVRGGSTLSGRFVAGFGTKLGSLAPLTHLFPSPAAIAELDPVHVAKVVGMPVPRGKAIVALARGVREGAVDLSPGADPAALDAALLALPGVGPWTSAYIAMRAARSADAFPAGDLVLKKRLGVDTLHAVNAWAEPLRPFRAYAAMHLWALSK
jgi:AraC family transcriptional regulator of adaptative response / DNA-3-methyladenine glycosylase II